MLSKDRFSRLIYSLILELKDAMYITKHQNFGTKLIHNLQFTSLINLIKDSSKQLYKYKILCSHSGAKIVVFYDVITNYKVSPSS
jgi:hypothetical protein